MKRRSQFVIAVLALVPLLAVAQASGPFCSSSAPSRVAHDGAADRSHANPVSRGMQPSSSLEESPDVSRIVPESGAAEPSLQITFAVDNGVRGAQTGAEFRLLEWPGRWQAGERYRIGERYLLFLHAPNAAGLTSPVGGSAGRFLIDSKGTIDISSIAPPSGTRNSPTSPSSPVSDPPLPRTALPQPRASLCSSAGTTRMTIRRLIVTALLCACSAVAAFAGGPLYVAGVSGFNSSATGQPITWAGGVVNYYTDQGNLSPLLPGASADAFVATAFASWSSVTTAALQINRAGQLSEDVSGSNVQNAGSLILPVDIQPNSAKPIAIIYDYDGSVIDAFLGTGAGSEDLCNSNSVIAEADNFTADGHFAHALVIINGNCAQYASDLPILQYRLARQLGRVLGLDWSQINDNVVTGAPPPTMNDYAGYPMMHPMGALCFPTYGCTSNPLQTRMDDQAAISRLYPVTAANIGNFSGKTLFFENTARIEGSVRFPAWNGNLGQGMQGVNVVARMIDPVTGLTSHKYTASCVSGFLFRGDAGNPITGYTDNSGEPLDRFGSNNAAVEGYFDLAGLQFPTGYSTVQYQLSVESVNSLYIDGLSVGPYKEGSIPMSGHLHADHGYRLQRF